jgi:hypothetical protein
MSTYDFKLQNVPGIQPTAPSSSGSDLARFLGQIEQTRANRKDEEYKNSIISNQTRQQDWVEGADDRVIANQLAISEGIHKANDALTDYKISNYRPNDVALDQLLNSQEFKAMTPEQQDAYINDFTALAERDARFHDPKLLEDQYAKLLLQHTGGRLTQEQLGATVDDRINTLYNVLPKDVSDKLLDSALRGEGGNPLLEVAGKAVGGSSGSKGTGEEFFNVNNALKTDEEIRDAMARWKVEGDKGPIGTFFRNMFDWGHRDLKEGELRDTVNSLVGYGLHPVAAMQAIDSIRKNDTTKFDLRELVKVQPDPNGNENQKALYQMLNVGNNYMAAMNARGGQSAGGSGASSIDIEGLLASAAQADRDRAQEIQTRIAGYKPQQMSSQNYRDFYLGGLKDPNSPQVAPAQRTQEEKRQLRLRDEQYVIPPKPVAKMSKEETDTLLDKVASGKDLSPEQEKPDTDKVISNVASGLSPANNEILLRDIAKNNGAIDFGSQVSEEFRNTEDIKKRAEEIEIMQEIMNNPESYVGTSVLNGNSDAGAKSTIALAAEESSLQKELKSIMERKNPEDLTRLREIETRLSEISGISQQRREPSPAAAQGAAELDEKRAKKEAEKAARKAYWDKEKADLEAEFTEASIAQNERRIANNPNLQVPSASKQPPATVEEELENILEDIAFLSRTRQWNDRGQRHKLGQLQKRKAEIESELRGGAR